MMDNSSLKDDNAARKSLFKLILHGFHFKKLILSFLYINGSSNNKN